MDLSNEDHDAGKRDAELEGVATSAPITTNDLDPRWDGAVILQKQYHFHARLLERYGLVLAPGEFTMITKAIRRGPALRISDGEHGDAIYAVEIPRIGEVVYVVANKRRLITTLRPSRRLDELRRKLMDPGGTNGGGES